MTINVKRFGLRELTREQHERLDAEVGDLKDRQSYMRYLKGISAFRRAVETPLGVMSFPDVFGSWRPTLVYGDLEADLSDLDLAPAAKLTSFELPPNISGLLGVLYVLEGSSLGARILIKRAAQLGFDEHHGARHLTAQTARPESWAGFHAILENMDTFDITIAAQAAARTFDLALSAFKAENRELAG
jgi:heme oxygenase